MSKNISLPSIKLAKNLNDKFVILRASLNVPVYSGEVLDEFRIIRSLDTIKYLKKNGAKVLILSHIGRKELDSLKPVYKVMKEQVDMQWGGAFDSSAFKSIHKAMKSGDIVMMENIRQHKGEELNDASLAQALAQLGDIFVNDAFAASHRTHASLVGIPKLLPTYFGLNFIREYEELKKAMTPLSPSLFILGGAKFETKLPLVEQYLARYDNVFVGGALANDIFKAQGFEVGQSLVSDVDLRNSSILKNQQLLLPVDVVVEGLQGVLVKRPDQVILTDKILDAGPDTVKLLKNYINRAKSVLWNGPLGDYEDGFGDPTIDVGDAVAKSKAYSLVGGGDTVAALKHNIDINHINFMSTAGGAMLTFLETGTLPAIDSVLHSKYQI
ncbi:phosphoglycerate kinase [bacterium]|nr:phosphoglycerate kinase [bacterium]